MLGMPDAAMVSQMASKDQVPDEMMVLWLASKGLPVTFASLVGRYRKLQEAANNPMGGAQIPKTTVAEDVNNGLASLQQNAVPPMPELTQLQDLNQPQQPPPQPPQPQQPPDQGQQMPPDQGQQMPPDQGQPPAQPGLAGLDPGLFNQGQGMAGGGIITFAEAGQVAQEQDQQNQEDALFNQLNPEEQADPAPTPAPQQQQTYKAPNTLDQVFQQYGEAEEDLDARFDAQIAELNKMEVYEPKNSPVYAQKRELLIKQKLADQNKIPFDQFDQLIAQGMAGMKEAMKPHEPGFGYMAATTAGLEAFYETGKKLEKEHETLQNKLDSDIIEQNKLEFEAQETNRKAAIDARNAKKKEIADLQEKILVNTATRMNNLAQLGISAINARTSMANAGKKDNTTDWEEKFKIEYEALKADPKNANLSDAQLKRMAYKNVATNDVTAAAAAATDSARVTSLYAEKDKEVRAEAKNPMVGIGQAIRQARKADPNTDVEAIIKAEIENRVRAALQAPQNLQEDQTTPTPAPAVSSASSSSNRRISLQDLPASRG
jgi:hypothetical protein